MKLLQMFIPYITVGAALTTFMLLVFGGDRAGAFLVTYTIGYAAVMLFLGEDRQ